MKYVAEQENLIKDNKTKRVFYYCDSAAQPVYKTREEFKQMKLVIVYPYTVDRVNGLVQPKKIPQIEFHGWDKIEDIPKDFNKSKYGFSSKRMKYFMSFVYRGYSGTDIEKIKFGKSIKTRFSPRSISFNWNEVEDILKEVASDISHFNKNKKTTILNALSGLSRKFVSEPRNIVRGELQHFLKKFDSFDRVNDADVNSLAEVLHILPVEKISVTSHFVKARERIDIAYIDDIISKFEKLVSEKRDNEEKWQVFFENYSWILNHLFSYQVILRKGKAYVGGKTIENEEGRIVDFLYQNEMKDNYALLEIKTHKKTLLKNTPYRKPDVFSISDELSGGVNQCLDQKDTFIKDFGRKYESFNPVSILIIGTKATLNSNQRKCFELYRANQKQVLIVTFDELLSKLKGLHKVIKSDNSRM